MQNHSGATPLLFAVYPSGRECVTYTVGYDTGHGHGPPRETYCWPTFRLNVLDLLLAHGADINKTCGVGRATILHEWTRHYGKDILGRERARRTAKSHGDPLYIPESPDRLGLLISRGADLEAKDIEGLTPLHYAVILGNRYAVSRLIKAGANVNARTARRESALGIAQRLISEAKRRTGRAEAKWELIIQTLQKHGAHM